VGYSACRVYYDDFMDWVQLMEITVVGGRRATSRTAERALRQLAEDGYLRREEHIGRYRRKYVIFWPTEKLQDFCREWEERAERLAKTGQGARA
jgi:hypothetical protein